MTARLTDYLEKRLREAFDYHGLCPDCEGMLCESTDSEGAWCVLCGYTRSTLMRAKPD